MQERKHLIRKTALAAMLGLAVMTSGCSSYYVVTDPKNGKQYYTTDWDTARGGTTQFVDGKTGAIVTIQESEIREISQKEFQENTKKK